MKHLVLAIAVMTTSLFAVEAEKLEVIPVVKAEMAFLQAIGDDAEMGTVVFGSNDFGAIATKGDVEVGGVISLVDIEDFGVELSKVYIKKGLGEHFSLTAGYQNLPFGHWTTNCVNYPLVRSGAYGIYGDFNSVKQKATQLDVGFDNGTVVADVAGYVGSDGTFNSLASKVSADLTVIAPNASIRIENMDTVDVAFGADVDFGVVGIYGSYTRGINVDRMGSYVEVSAFPNDWFIPSIRADLLANTETKDGLANFSLSTLFIVTDNVYAGLEYNIYSVVDDSELQTPDHGLTALIGCEF